ncbi:diguanylate cyclase [Marinococcus sp. PL1-022]|uniref:GGDEF domain-containing protein n=1 Tax=Marinococcus sp. PL1-022 TaxID=3095363 RepID=UPI0029C5989E|nr:diguanylate cyclase [Marinococcus sp. PL1-022]MDX6153961.1 diguanylate cyclase [Marinococcus sp. PL1-022]
MLSGFFINITILISFIFLFHRLFYKAPLSSSSSFKQKAAAGAASGLLGVILLVYSIPLDGNTIIDLRVIPIILMAVFGGWIPTIIAGAIIMAGRLMFDLSISSVAALVFIAASVLAGGVLHMYVRSVWIRSAWLVLLTNIYMAVLLSLLLPFNSWASASAIYSIATLIGTLIAVYMFLHLTRVSRMFSHYQYQASRDNLTGLYNQRAFQDMLQQAEREYTNSSRPLSLLVLDIDYFKSINDTHGHLEGDAVLKQLSQVLIASIRPDDQAFRIGGEEFGILLYDCDETHALTIAERVRSDVAQTPFRVANHPSSLSITISIGTATYPAPGQDISALYSAADDALYQAKHLGRNRTCSYRPSGQGQEML